MIQHKYLDKGLAAFRSTIKTPTCNECVCLEALTMRGYWHLSRRVFQDITLHSSLSLLGEVIPLGEDAAQARTSAVESPDLSI